MDKRKKQIRKNTREGRMGEERREVTIEGYGKMNYGWKEEKGEE